MSHPEAERRAVHRTDPDGLASPRAALPASIAWLGIALLATPLLLATLSPPAPHLRLWSSVVWVGLVTAVGLRFLPYPIRAPRARALLLGVLAGLAAFPLTGIVYAVMESLGQTAAMPDPASLPAGAGPWLVAGMVAAAVVEELAFRGLLQRALTGPTSPVVAVLASASIFALYHGAPSRWPATFLLGLIVGALYHRRGLAAAMAAHATYNLIGAAIFLLAPR